MKRFFGKRKRLGIFSMESTGTGFPLLDKPMFFSADRADDLAAIARRTSEVVVGCGPETMTGSYWLSAFTGDGG